MAVVSEAHHSQGNFFFFRLCVSISPMHEKDQKEIIRAARAGGEALRKYFGKVLTVTEKSMASDVRTEADIESEAAVIKILEKAFPSYNIFSEECGMISKNSEYTFYIDPLDGTNNFALGIPNFSVSIALVRKTETIFGLVYLPITDLLYHAVKGGGAFCNKQKLSISTEKDLARSTSAFECGYNCPKPFIIKIIGNLSRRTKRVLVNWSVASDLCLLAAGKVETIVSRKTELHDFLAGKLIAREAGSIVTDFKGKAEKNDLNRMFLVSSNSDIHRKVLPLL